MKQAHSEITITTQSRLLLLHGLKKVYNRDSKKKDTNLQIKKKKDGSLYTRVGGKIKNKIKLAYKNYPPSKHAHTHTVLTIFFLFSFLPLLYLLAVHTL